ncbi:MAG TPA: DUF6179 domain-containing protein [Clostridia bacterium]
MELRRITPVPHGKRTSELSGRASLPLVQAELAQLLGEQIRKYTAGDSSSVKDETASAMLASIAYCVDAFFARLGNPEDFSQVLDEKGLRSVYDEGVRLVQTCVAETKTLYSGIFENLLAVPLAAYHDTIDTAVPEFFTNYDVEFHANDTPCSMDYPLALDDAKGYGVFYIRSYLLALRTETDFCARFELQSVLRTLSDYDKKYKLDLYNAPFNLFECVFDQAIFSVLCGNDPATLRVSALQLEHAAGSWAGKTHTEMQVLLEQATGKMISALHIDTPAAVDYLRRYREKYARRFLDAFDSGQLPHLALLDDEPVPAGKTLFQDGDRMLDEEFLALIEELQAGGDAVEKIRQISERVHSVRDLLDLLESGCLYGDEFSALFGVLGDTEMAVLGNTVFFEELRFPPLRLSAIDASEMAESAEWEWQAHYLEALFRIDDLRRTEIERLINHLDCEHTNVS